jgi:hypothetical protein
VTTTDSTASIETLRSQLDHLLQRHGATARAMGHDDVRGQAFIAFAIAGKQVRMQIPMPKPSDWPDPGSRSWMQPRQDCPQEWNGWNVHQRCEWVAAQMDLKTRARWRCTLELATAKFNAIDEGITTVELEFLSDTATPDGRTVGEWMRPGVEAVFAQVNRLEAAQEVPAFGAHGVEKSSAMVVKKTW